MTEKLPSVMKNVLASPTYEGKKEPVPSTDSEASTDYKKRKQKEKKTCVQQGVKKTATHQDSDSETENAFPHRKQKPLKKMRTHPYTKPLTEQNKKRAKSQKATESSDREVLSD